MRPENPTWDKVKAALHEEFPELNDRVLSSTHKQRVEYLSAAINGVNPTTDPVRFEVLFDLYLLALDYDEAHPDG